MYAVILNDYKYELKQLISALKKSNFKSCFISLQNAEMSFTFKMPSVRSRSNTSSSFY